MDFLTPSLIHTAGQIGHYLESSPAVSKERMGVNPETLFFKTGRASLSTMITFKHGNTTSTCKLVVEVMIPDAYQIISAVAHLSDNVSVRDPGYADVLSLTQTLVHKTSKARKADACLYHGF